MGVHSIHQRSSPAFQQLSNSNHGPLIIVTAYIALICSCLAVTIKTWTRLSTARSLAMTDSIMLVGILLAIAQTIALTLAVNNGLGEHIDKLTSVQLESVSQAFYASNILLMGALAGAKASVTYLIISIKPLRPVLLASYGLLGVIALWLIAGIFALAFQCSVPTPWRLGPNQCVDQYALQIALGAVNIVTDLAIIILALLMMRSVQVANSKKWTVVALFALRIATPAFTIIALYTFHTYYQSSPQDRTWHAVLPCIWTQVMLNISIITACIPSIKRFFADVQSGLMGVTISEQYELTHSGGKTIQQSQGGTAGGSWQNSRLASRLGVLSRKSQGGSAIHSQTGEKLGADMEPRFGNMAQVKGGPVREHSRETESVKGLTQNVIHQKIDYDIDYERRSSEGRTSSHRDRHFNDLR